MKSFDQPKFPRRIYTENEVKLARSLIEKGHRHRLSVVGNAVFKQKTKQAVALIKTAGYFDFFRTYIRKVRGIDGLTQLRQSEAGIWANEYAVKNPVDAASVFFQKANQMKEYLEGTTYYGGQAERRSDEKRIEFLEALSRKSKDQKTVAESQRLIKMWKDSALVY